MRRGLSLSGVLIVDTYRGNVRVRRWPKKRGKAKTIAEQQRRDTFRDRLWISKFEAPPLQVAYREDTHRSGIYPRDMSVMMTANKGFHIVNPDGTRQYNMTTLLNVSDILDVAAQLDGQMLIRENGLWRPLPWGTLGQVLKSQGVGNPPLWQAEGGGGGGLWELVAIKNASDDSEIAFTSADYDPADYLQYQLQFQDVVPVDASKDLYMHFSDDDGASYFSSAYAWWNNREGSALSASHTDHSNDSEIQLARSVKGGVNNVGITGYINLPNLNVTTDVRPIDWLLTAGNGTSDIITWRGGAVHEGSTAVIDAFRMKMETGNITSGKFRLLGATA